jgi:cytochrome c553
MKFRLSSLLVLAAFLWSCNQVKPDDQTYAKFQSMGNEISTHAQTTLLANVGKAIQQGGPEYAVEFCNLQVSGIVDSLNRQYNCVISRVSEKNRNPANQLDSGTDMKIWKAFALSTSQDTVVGSGKQFLYYKRISTSMPACLKCHGDTQTDINQPTLKKLQALYPEDKATGYQLNDFRGLWKIKFENVNN